MKKIVSNIIMFIILVAYISIMFYGLKDAKYHEFKLGLIISIILGITYSSICFFVPKIRSKATILWGVLSLVSVACWIFLLIKFY